MTDTRLQGRIAVITGASSGLGKATALKFAKSGARVVVADLSSSGVEDEITSKHGKDSAIFVKVDVTQESEIQALIQKVVEFGGRIDILANFAGIAHEGKNARLPALHEANVEDFDRTWAINVRGGWLANKYAIIEMLKQEPQPPNSRNERTKGWILNVASVYGLVGGVGLPLYTPSKHAVVGMTKQMAAQYATERIHVNAVCPSYVHTPMIEDVTSNTALNQYLENIHPWKSLGNPADVADAALFLCSDEAAWITGHSLTVDGGFSIV